MTEDEAVQRCQHGDRDAFRYLVERHQNVVLGTAYNMTGNRALAEELAQEAFLSAWKGIRGVQARESVQAVADAHPGQHGDGASPQAVGRDPLLIEESEWADDAEHPAALAESRLEQQTIQQAIRGLSPEHRLVVVLRYFADMTVPEVARASGVNEGTVKSRLHRAHQALRQRLGDAQWQR